MRILAILANPLGWCDPGTYGGGEGRSVQVLKRWHSFGASITTLETVPYPSRILGCQYKIKNVYVPVRKVNAIFAPIMGAVWLINVLLHVMRLKSLREHFDVVISMTSNLSDVIPAWIASVIFKASFVIYFHVTVYSSSFVETFHRFRGEKIGYASSMVRSLGAIIVLLVSKSYATNFCVSRVVSNNIARAGISPNRIFTTSNGVDLNHINSIKPLSSKIYDAAFLGRVEPNKGIHDLLKAWKKVVDEGDRKLLVIGSGSYLENAIKVSKELRLSKHVIFVGRVNENDKYRLLKSSKLLVFPTLASEGWGLVAIEALACGLPVICYDNPALVSVLGNCECAFFTPTGDIQKLAATINRVLSAQKMLESWSFLAKAYATNFDIDAVAKREFELLMSISKSLPRKIE